jgi:ubiquinone/menaquinone biosynthesis C-methylase UbiE
MRHIHLKADRWMMREQALTADYDAAAERWSGMLRRLGYDQAYRRFLRRVLDTRHGRVCDMGSGTGDLALAYVAEKGWPEDLVLVDTAPRMLAEAAKRLSRARTVQARLDRFTDADGFDLVMAAHLIEHCPDPGQALRQLAGLVRPGGKVVLVVSKPHWCQWLIWLHWRHRWFAPGTVLALARTAGLVPVATVPFDHGPPQRTSLGYLFHLPKGNLR